MGDFIFKRFCMFLCACVVFNAHCESGARVEYLSRVCSVLKAASSVPLEVELASDVKKYSSSECLDSKNVSDFKDVEARIFESIGRYKFENGDLENSNNSLLKPSQGNLQTKVSLLHAEILKINAKLDEKKQDVSQFHKQQIDSPTGSVSSVDLSQCVLKSDVLLERLAKLEERTENIDFGSVLALEEILVLKRDVAAVCRMIKKLNSVFCAC